MSTVIYKCSSSLLCQFCEDVGSLGDKMGVCGTGFLNSLVCMYMRISSNPSQVFFFSILSLEIHAREVQGLLLYIVSRDNDD